jgi:limonene-1,2-epoxide hydrolase
MSSENSAERIVMACVNAINKEDFETARQYVSDDMSFVGVLGTRQGADAYFNDMERLRLKYDVKKVFVDEKDVCLLYDLNMGGTIIFCCGWYQVQDGRIRSLRVVFDPRPILEAASKPTQRSA